MPTYAIGDIQGCFSAFEKILKEIQFDPKKDTLWLTGDLVNRGSESLQVLRFAKALGNRCQIVLGNHDLHLLAVCEQADKLHRGDTFTDVLTAPDRDELLDWLAHRPLIFHDEGLDFVMVHAGLPPFWDVAKAMSLAKEVETVLQSHERALFLKNMYGNKPDLWDDALTGVDRLRCITNYLTRMRLCHANGRLDFFYSGKLEDKPTALIPWFLLPRPHTNVKIIFGHWAALGGVTNIPNCYALDTGCVWGHYLTAMRLEDEKQFQVRCK